MDLKLKPEFTEKYPNLSGEKIIFELSANDFYRIFTGNTIIRLPDTEEDFENLAENVLKNLNFDEIIANEIYFTTGVPPF